MNLQRNISIIALLLSFVLLLRIPAKADSVTEWNTRACELAAPASFDTPNANRIIALMHTAIYEAVNAITKKYPVGDVKIDAPGDASVDAAVASAAHVTLSKI
jgi:hypothetical protein